MNCREAERLLHLWLDDELDENERRELTAHLAECGDCARKLAEYKHLGALLDALDANTKVPAGLYGRIMEAVDRESAPVKGGHRWARWAASAAAVLLLGVTVGVLWRADIWPGPMNKSAVPYEMARDDAAPQEAPAAEMEKFDALLDGADDTGNAVAESADMLSEEAGFGSNNDTAMEATWDWSVKRSGGDWQRAVDAIKSFCDEQGLTVLETGEGWIRVQWENDDGKQVLIDFLEENGALVFENPETDTRILRINIK
jgi:hypothetical protein